MALPSAIALAPSSSTWIIEGEILDISTNLDLNELGAQPGTTLLLRASTIVVREGVSLRAAHGHVGAAGGGENAVGGPGGKGGDIVLEAAEVIMFGELVAGNGGNGGSAYAVGVHATSRGGAGGEGGRIIGFNGPDARWGIAGSGGDAEARGLDGTCDALDGSNASTVGQSRSGLAQDGEPANASAGRGADGCVPGSRGGDGGYASAIGGDSGSIGDKPGQPGSATAYGGHAGHGAGDCASATASGGDGGRGGDAFAQAGNISAGFYRQAGNVTGGNAFARAGNAGNGAIGAAYQGNGGEGGYATALAGQIAATVIAGSGANGGSAVAINGGHGSGGPGCSIPRAGVPFPSALGLIAALGVLAIGRRARRP